MARAIMKTTKGVITMELFKSVSLCPSSFRCSNSSQASDSLQEHLLQVVF
jgi:hypothetical protein